MILTKNDKLEAHDHKIFDAEKEQTFLGDELCYFALLYLVIRWRPDQALFERSRRHLFLQMEPKYWGTFGLFRKSLLNKSDLANFWETFELLFIPTSGHTELTISDVRVLSVNQEK